MNIELTDPSQFRIKELTIMTKGGPIDISAIYEEINIYDSLFIPMLSGNILLTDAVGLSKTLNFDGSETILIDIEKGASLGSLTKSFRIYKQTDRKNVNQTAEKYILHFISDEYIFSSQQRVNQSYETTYSDVIKKIMSQYLKLDENEKGIIENSFGIRKVVIPNLQPIEAIEWCTRRSVDDNNSPSFLFYANLFGHNYVSLSTLMSNDSILRVSFAPKDLSKNDPLLEISRARSYTVLVQNDSIEKIRNGVDAGKFIGFDPITRSFNEKLITFDDHYNSIDHLNKNPNKTQISNKDNTTNLTTVNSRKVISIFGANRKNSSYIKKYDPSSISKVQNYEDILFQRSAILKNLVIRRMQLVMPGNFQLTSGFNVDVETSGFKTKNDGAQDQDDSLTAKYLIIATRHCITGNKHETLIEVVTDSTNDSTNYTSNPQQNEMLALA